MSKLTGVAAELRDRVAGWLLESGIKAKEEEVKVDEPHVWHLSITWPADSSWSINIGQAIDQPDLVQIVASVAVNEDHLAKLQAMPPLARQDFNRALFDAVVNGETAFSAVVSPMVDDIPDSGIIEAFNVEARAYDDGLTKTLFFDKLLRVHVTRIQAVRAFQIELEDLPAQ